MTLTVIDAQRFWDLYFRNTFLTLERTQEVYRGQIFEDSGQMASPLDLIQEQLKLDVQASIASLRSHDNGSDGRFALYRQLSIPLSDAVEQIIQQTYPYRDPPPFGKKRMSELFANIKREFGQLTPSLPALEEMVQSKVTDYSDAKAQALAALAWFLGQRREVSSSKSLLAVVRNAQFAPYARHFIHFTAVDSALSALWKVNDKLALFGLLELMHEMPADGRRKLAPLFSRLLSSSQLLSLTLCGPNYFQPEFWAQLLQPRRNFSATDWHRFDADSLFWEIRYLSALRLPVQEAAALRKLSGDEVTVVRNLAVTKTNG